MIDEIKLLTQLQDELANARAKYWENDTDSFYGGMCSALEEVITIVNKQPTIEREIIDKMYGTGGYIEKEIINKLFGTGNYIDTDSVNNGGWIPCSERMPEIGLDVLCFKEGGSIVIAEWGGEESSYLDEKAVWFLRRGWCRKNHIVAWQPLPEPYKEGQNEK